MTVHEIEREIENVVDKGAQSNTDLRHVTGLAARGIWEVALQLAKANRTAEMTQETLRDTNSELANATRVLSK